MGGLRPALDQAGTHLARSRPGQAHAARREGGEAEGLLQRLPGLPFVLVRMQQTEQLWLAGCGVAAALLVWVAAEKRKHRTAWHAMEGWISKRPIFKFVNADKLLVITDFDATLTTGEAKHRIGWTVESRAPS